jgi:hypothetical protein
MQVQLSPTLLGSLSSGSTVTGNPGIVIVSGYIVIPEHSHKVLMRHSQLALAKVVLQSPRLQYTVTVYMAAVIGSQSFSTVLCPYIKNQTTPRHSAAWSENLNPGQLQSLQHCSAACTNAVSNTQYPQQQRIMCTHTGRSQVKFWVSVPRVFACTSEQV